MRNAHHGAYHGAFVFYLSPFPLPFFSVCESVLARNMICTRARARMHGRTHAHRCTYSNMPVTVVGDVPVIPYTNQIVKVASDLSLVIHVVEVCQWGHSQSDQAGSDSEPGHKKHKKHKTSYDASGRKVFHLYQTIHGRLLAKEWARIRELCVDFLTASTVMPNPICQMKLVDEYRRDGYRIISTSTYSIAPLFFQNGDKSEFEMCFAPSWGEGGGWGGGGAKHVSNPE